MDESLSRPNLLGLSRSNTDRPASTDPDSALPLDSGTRRRFGSMPATNRERSATRRSSTSSTFAETMEADEDVDDDVAFWGGVSHRERAEEKARLGGGSERSPIRFWQSSISRDEDEDDGENQSDDYDDDDDDDSTNDDEDEDDAEEIFNLAGHR